MTKKGENTEEKVEDKKKTCFVIMPISDTVGYDSGHFNRVYQHIIKPACERAGFEAKLASEEAKSNNIVVDILQKIIESDMALCDLSSNNPNVLYELGLRQAFNKPVTLIKDEGTDKIFDIASIRFIPYSESLRADYIEPTVAAIAKSLKETYEAKENPLIQSLSIEAAQISNKTVLSDETSVLLKAINNLSKNVVFAENKSYKKQEGVMVSFKLPNGRILKKDDSVYNTKTKELLGYIIGLNSKGDIVVNSVDNNYLYIDILNYKDYDFDPF